MTMCDGASEPGVPDAMPSGGLRTWVTHPDPVIRRNRHQAAETFPIIAWLLDTDADIPNPAHIQAAIDHGYPLVDALSSILGIGKAAVRCLRGVATDLLGQAWLERPSDLFATLDRLPPPKMPRSKSDWKHFRELATACARLVDGDVQKPSLISNSRDSVAWHVFHGLCSAGYEASAKRIRRELGEEPDAWMGMKKYFCFVSTWLESGAGFCEMNHHLQDLARSRLRDVFLARYSAIELIRQSTRWRRETEKLRSAGYGADLPPESYDWPALPGLPLQVNDRLVVSLTSAAELNQEAIRLFHCVDLFFEVCVFGYSHIISIRTLDGESLSTAEITLGRDERRWVVPKVGQHQAAGNNAPGSGCDQALQATLAMLGSPERQRDLEEIEHFHASRFEQIKFLLQHARGEYPVQLMTDVMRRVLHDAERAFDWLDRRLAEEEGWYRHRNDQAGERFERMGFDGELTWDRAVEAYLATRTEEIFDDVIGLLRERHWRDSFYVEPDRYGRAAAGVKQTSRDGSANANIVKLAFD
jgi:hypothetical protein